MPNDAKNAISVYGMRLDFVHFIVNLMTCFAVVVFVIITLHEGISLKNAGTDYIENTNLTAYVASQLAKIDSVLTELNQTMGDVTKITRSSRAAVEDGTVGATTRSFLNATRRFPEVSREQIKDLTGNATRFLGSLAAINFSSVTNLLMDAHDPATQRSVRERIDHALRSFDFATLGMTQMFGTIGRAMTPGHQTAGAVSQVTAEL